MLDTLRNYEGDKGMGHGGGIIRLWHDLNFKEKRWRTKGTWGSDHFSYFFVPYPLKYRNDDGDGTFFYGRQWRYENKEVGIAGVGTDLNKSNQRITCYNVRGDHDCMTWGFPRIIEQTYELYAPLYTNDDTWLPFCVIPWDGSVGSYDSIVYFIPFQSLAQ